MKLNMTSKILESVQSTNEDTRVKSYKVLKEENVIKEGLNTCPRCGKEIIGYPAVSRFDNETEICSDCGMDEAFENMAGYMTNPNTGEKMSLDDLRNQKRAKSMSDEDLEKVMNGTMDDYSYSTIKAKDDFDKKKAIEDRAFETITILLTASMISLILLTASINDSRTTFVNGSLLIAIPTPRHG